MNPISEELYRKIVESSKDKKSSKLFLNISDFPISHKNLLVYWEILNI